MRKNEAKAAAEAQIDATIAANTAIPETSRYAAKVLTCMGKSKEELTTMYTEVLQLFDKSMEMFVTNKKDNIDEIIDMENDVDQMQIDYQNQQVKRLSKGVCGVEIGLIFTDMVIGLERIADHSTNIAYSIFHENPEDAEEQQKVLAE